MDYYAYYKGVDKETAVKMLKDNGFEIKKIHNHTPMIDISLGEMSKLEEKITELGTFGIDVRLSQKYAIPKGEELKKP